MNTKKSKNKNLKHEHEKPTIIKLFNGQKCWVYCKCGVDIEYFVSNGEWMTLDRII